MKKLLLGAALGAACLLATGCQRCAAGKEDGGRAAPPAPPAPAGSPAGSPPAAAKPADDPARGTLEVTDVKVGTGDEAVAGKTVTIHYLGTLRNGTKFDSSRDRGQPFSFPLGADKVIPGFDQGITGMRAGGVRKLVVPPHLGYGDRAVGAAIPANSTLVFEIELLRVE